MGSPSTGGSSDSTARITALVRASKGVVALALPLIRRLGSAGTESMRSSAKTDKKRLFATRTEPATAHPSPLAPSNARNECNLVSMGAQGADTSTPMTCISTIASLGRRGTRIKTSCTVPFLAWAWTERRIVSRTRKADGCASDQAQNTTQTRLTDATSGAPNARRTRSQCRTLAETCSDSAAFLSSRIVGGSRAICPASHTTPHARVA